ncbi:acryloyl-CoA reductase [Lacihabitans sp. LS3-19]|uniref:YhdH/YhfP family quinone oxidoreductase n=1 Tax=Lacihabitans sp. LS3-19 TaxID=2487335 RepID=UPI0020CEA93B|nr:YhdH/YhfP family quinone oxidoreductase [Lacihabitans sp. LS3-19]MCP9767508.1 acryloyl-CoA reductase [Lacihabitans sp. LS3-19]
MEKFKKLTVFEDDKGSFFREIEEVGLDSLKEDEVIINVKYSSLNYKDALSASGNKGVTKNYPHTPGIDAAGIVFSSKSSEFNPGDEVIVTSYDLGMNTAGGFSEFISVPAKWIIKKPKGLTLKESMILGTAGLTAAMSIDKLLTFGVEKGNIIVSGATGGVGSLAIMILNKLNFEVTALSRKISAVDFLKNIGAKEIIQSFEENKRPLLKPIYAGAIDTVGGNVLENILKQIKPNGIVSICGMALSANINTTVFPFILRGIAMIGIDSAEADYIWRKNLWEKLGKEWKPENLETIAKTVKLENINIEIEKMLKGNQTGRVVVEI